MTDASYVDYLFRVLDREPDRALLIHRGQRITRRAVRDGVLRYAGALRAAGLRPGEVVAALTGNRPAALYLQLAVHALGGRYLPLPAGPEPFAPLAAARPAALVVDPGLTADPPPPGIRTVLSTLELAGLAAARPPEDLAVEHAGPALIFPADTAGDGVPLVVHWDRYYGALVALAAVREGQRAADAAERLLVGAPLARIGCQAAVLMTLLGGGSVVLGPVSRWDAGLRRAQTRPQTTPGPRLAPAPTVGRALAEPGDPDELLDLIGSCRANALIVSTPELYGLLDHPRLPACDLSGLTRVIHDGRPMPPDRMAAAVARFGGRFSQVYGRAEAATVSVLDWPGGAPVQDRRLRSAGRAPFGVDIAIQDDRGGHLPPGSTGEVCVKGLLVMSEYLGRPDLTRRRLRGGWLHTGDLGHLDSDGYLYLDGRLGVDSPDVEAVGR